MIYVDTSAWFAGSVTTDQNYQVAKAIFESADPRQLVTTDYVVDECLTLMKARSENARALEFGRSVLEESVCRLIWVERDDVFKAWAVFQSHRHRAWSFTDCVSRVVIERFQIDRVFSFDKHFREFGTINVVP